MQSMDFHINDNVLVIGTGSGYLTECASYLTNTVSSYEIDSKLYNYGKNNIDLYSKNRHKIDLNHQSILDCLNKLSRYSKVIFTCSVDTYETFINYLAITASHWKRPPRSVVRVLEHRDSPVQPRPRSRETA